MADIQSAVQWLGTLLVEEAKYLSRVADNVKELQDELDWMLCFLKDADAIQYDNVIARRWVAQIRELAYEAEDMIEQFLVKVNTSIRRRDLLSSARRYSKILKKYILLHQTGSKIDSLKHKISRLTSKLHTYGIQFKWSGSSSAWLSNSRNKHYIGSAEPKLIGRDDDLKYLVDVLVRESNEAEKESKGCLIFGLGGVGKTFLAKHVFQDERIRRYFDAFAWAYVSQPCQSSAVQQDLLSSLTSKSKVQIAQMSDSEMKNELCKVQRKYKCFIVLDGLWEDKVWDNIKEAFPVISKSKLLITSRSHKVACHVKKDLYVAEYELKGLKDEDSTILLNEKLKGCPPVIHDEDSMKEKCKGSPASTNQPSSSSSLSMKKEDSRDHDLDQYKEKLLQYCKGLPLIISLLGGVLATKRTLKDWRKVDNDISVHLIDDYNNDQHQPQKRILELSYYDLPYQLKPSFLYLGFLPTNLDIPTTKIIRLWEAEGLVSHPDDEGSSSYTLEEVAENYLNELLERSLLQVGTRDLTGKAKTCRVHDLMRDLCISKAEKVNWLNIVKFGVDEDRSPGSLPTSKHYKKSNPMRKFRRLAIYYSSTSGKLPSGSQAKYVRSLLLFNTLETEEVLVPVKKMFLHKIFADYKLLRVLDIENIEVQRLPSSVGTLIHLRYLSIGGSWVSKLPFSLKNLRCLQTLDLRVLSFVSVRLPDVLFEMERLIHLYLPTLLEVNKIIQLKNLHKLETLENFSDKCKAEDLAELVRLRKFSSCDFLSRKSLEPFLGSSSLKLNHIEHLSLKLDGGSLYEITQPLTSCRKLCVKGQIPQAFRFYDKLPKLIKLSFCYTEFQSDLMEDLGKLKGLKKLSFYQGNFFGRSALVCSETGFPELEYLTLEGLKNLEHWKVDEAAMPKLSHLKIKDCRNLKEIPLIKSLKEIELSYMPFTFFNEIPLDSKEFKNWEQCKNVEHIPNLKIYNVLDLEERREPTH